MMSALISLEATVVDGNDYRETYNTSGKVQVSDLTCYSYNGTCPGAITAHARAHAYGEMILAANCGPYDDVDDILASSTYHRYYCRSDRQEFAHLFYEYNMDDIQGAYPHFTQRIITASTGVCDEYDQIGEAIETKLGIACALRYQYKNIKDGTMGNITIPSGSLGKEGTTYISRYEDDPQTVSNSCGDRCIYIWVYKAFSKSKDDPGQKFYRCPITISNVTNAQQVDHKVSKSVAQAAAASIALQGQWHGLKEDGTPDFAQYQFYAAGSVSPSIAYRWHRTYRK